MSSKVETIGRISEDGISKIQKVLLSDTDCGKGIRGFRFELLIQNNTVWLRTVLFCFILYIPYTTV